MDCVHVQANIDPITPPEEWMPLLEPLADKMKQYCYMLSDLNGEILGQVSDGDYEKLRAYLRERGTQAYEAKVSVICCA